MRDLRSQLRAYAEHLDAAAPPLDDLDLERTVPDLRPAPVPSVTRRLLVGAAAAVVVLAAVGIAALAFGSGAEPVVATTAPSTTVATVPESTPAALVVAGDGPVLTFGDPSEDEGPFVGPGGVVLVDGTYHMLFNRYGEGVSGIGYAASDDLVSWDIRVPEVIGSGDVPAAEFGMQARTAVRLPDGTWALYFDYETKLADDMFGVAIGAATAPAPEGPWTVVESALLGPGAGPGWMANGAKHPSVLLESGDLVMYFAGVDLDGVGRIGRATSEDGVVWTPDETWQLEATQGWERGSLTRPNVIRDGDRLLMLYAGRTSSGQGFVVSRDGVTWSDPFAEPVLTTSDVVRAQIRDTELAVGVDGAIRLLIENGGARTSSDIWLMEEAP